MIPVCLREGRHCCTRYKDIPHTKPFLLHLRHKVGKIYTCTSHLVEDGSAASYYVVGAVVAVRRRSGGDVGGDHRVLEEVGLSQESCR